MCLHTFTQITSNDKLNQSNFHYGYKVFNKDNNGKINSPLIYSGPYTLHQWCNEKDFQSHNHAPNEGFGFHICKTLESAREMQQALWCRNHSAIMKVKYRKIVADGLDGLTRTVPTIVAREMKIIKEVV